ncbi:MAG: hypothetical protein FWE88_06490 [Phycisphaerae bacterium]|nr:hypothetical protein [Phycisphaerae bacterium]
MTNNEDAIRVDVIPFDENVPLKQLYGPAKKWARSQFQGKTFINKDTGQPIEITGKGIDHTVSVARNPDVIHSLSVLPEMIERATCISSEPPRPPKEGKRKEQDLVAVEIFETKVRIREKLYTAELVVKVEEKNNRRIGMVSNVRLYYHHRLYEK